MLQRTKAQLLLTASLVQLPENGPKEWKDGRLRVCFKRCLRQLLRCGRQPHVEEAEVVLAPLEAGLSHGRTKGAGVDVSEQSIWCNPDKVCGRYH